MMKSEIGTIQMEAKKYQGEPATAGSRKRQRRILP